MSELRNRSQNDEEAEALIDQTEDEDEAKKSVKTGVAGDEKNILVLLFLYILQVKLNNLSSKASCANLAWVVNDKLRQFYTVTATYVWHEDNEGPLGLIKFLELFKLQRGAAMIRFVSPSVCWSHYDSKQLNTGKILKEEVSDLDEIFFVDTLTCIC